MISINYVWTIRPYLHGSGQIFELTNFYQCNRFTQNFWYRLQYFLQLKNLHGSARTV